MSKIKTKIFKIVPQIFKKYPVAFAYLYGSYANGLEHSFSDIDICIYTDNISADKKLSLQMAISLEIDEKLQVGKSSEVRIMNDLPLVIKGQIFTQGILIYSKNDDLRSDVESFTRRTYFDFLPVIREYQQVYIDRVIS